MAVSDEFRLRRMKAPARYCVKDRVFACRAGGKNWRPLAPFGRSVALSFPKLATLAKENGAPGEEIPNLTL